MQIKTIVLIGSGRVATHFAELFVQREDLSLVQIYARRPEALGRLAQRLGQEVSYTNKLSDICLTADYYLFALSDGALPSVWSEMPQTDGVWLHTAGSVALETMTQYHSESGVLYPLQTFSLEQDIDWSCVPLYIEGANPSTLEAVRTLALSISPTVYETTSSQRIALHLGAVLACNFSNHLIALAQAWLVRNALPSDSLMPLIRATMNKLECMSAHEAQTGPAHRGDHPSLETHLSLLNDLPQLQQLYMLISESIMQASVQVATNSPLTLK
ncbi:MAG: DUF2520 domain-containing protein [Porphyromonadaceae bacterium]|nr:DUF2520 domain-containing protein [Porphyromonadaceae bacterium]